MHTDDLLAAYDAQLRTDAETLGADCVTVHGPLYLSILRRVRGFISYRDLAGADVRGIRTLVGEALEHYRRLPEITSVEWKTRAHDVAPGLHEALLEHGFTRGEPESVMVGEARLLAVDVPLPDGVALRTVQRREDVLACCVMQGEIFGDEPGRAYAMAEDMLRRLARDGVELWVAEAGGVVVCAGRLEPVDGSDFAGIWGGCTRPEWRGRGIYRALTAARARSALRLGKTLVNSDSTEFSRPILERSGLVKVSTTIPHEWVRG